MTGRAASALSALADHVPEGSRLVLAGRAEPPLRIPRLRAEGRITEIGPEQLSLTREEAASLLAGAGVVLGEDEVTELHRRTEGWPAGLYLAALYVREGGQAGSAGVSFSGDDRFVSDYVESEFLARISRRQRVFLTRTAALERMSGPLCEAVLEMPGSAATLGGSRPLEHAPGATGPAGRVVPLPPPVPRHAPGAAAPARARPDGRPAPPRRALVPAQRPARGSAGVLHRRRGRGHRRSPGGGTRDRHPPARPVHHPAALVPVAGRPGRNRRAPDGRRAGRALLRADGAAGRGRAVG